MLYWCYIILTTYKIIKYPHYINHTKNIHRNIIHIDVLHIYEKKGNVLVCISFRSLSHLSGLMDDIII